MTAKDEDRIDDLTEAMVASQAMDDRVDYIRRGRAHADLTTGEVEQLWTTAFKAWVGNIAGPRGTQQPMNDAGAELSIRGVTVPWEKVMPEMQDGLEQARKAGPNRPGLDDAIARFLAALHKSKN